MIIILNGPAGSGKDTIADVFVNHHPEFITDSFKSALFIQAAKEYEVNVDWLIDRHNRRDLKEIPVSETIPSTRDMLIYTSEKVIKPKYGKDHFGVVKGLHWKNKMVIVSDGGFHEETNAVGYLNGTNNTIVIRLRREGFDFKGDSRNYIKKVDSLCPVFDVELQTGNVVKAINDINQIIENL